MSETKLETYDLGNERMVCGINHIQRMKISEQWTRVKLELDILQGALNGSLFKEHEYSSIPHMVKSFIDGVEPDIRRFDRE